MIDLLKKYKPALLFILKFVGIYVVLNLLYAWFVEYNYPQPDPFTIWVTEQTSWFLNIFQLDTVAVVSPSEPHVYLFNQYDISILSVYEGCNGLNVMIIFLAFILSFHWRKSNSWFIPLGLLIIHIANIIRVTLLYFVSERFEQYMYFTHKYLFTASIFAVVFILWYVWLTRIFNTGIQYKRINADQ